MKQDVLSWHTKPVEGKLIDRIVDCTTISGVHVWVDPHELLTDIDNVFDKELAEPRNVNRLALVADSTPVVVIENTASLSWKINRLGNEKLV